MKRKETELSKIGPMKAGRLEIMSTDNGCIVRLTYGPGESDRMYMGEISNIAVFNDPMQFGLWMNEWLCNLLNTNETKAGRSGS